MHINCQSIVNKKHEFYSLLDDHKPDIVVGTESWLNKEHLDSEFFPKSLGYTPFREDRATGKKGGGVFILVRDCFIATKQNQLKTACEILWVKIEIVACKPLYVAAFYRPHETDFDSALELEKSLDLVRSLKGTKWILGDFNYPKFSWDSEHVPTILPGCGNHQIYEHFTNLLDDHCLIQMVTENTRLGNILDLFLTSNITLVDDIQIHAGISDHDIITITSKIKPTTSKQKPRNIPLYRKADWNGFRNFVSDAKPDILKDYEILSIDELWSKFKSTVHAGIDKYVPIKRCGSKKALPWVTQEIKRLIRKRDKLFKKIKTGRSNDRCKKMFHDLKQTIKQKIKVSHNSYLENILEIDEEQSSKFNTKKIV